jgi:hypothetical protein
VLVLRGGGALGWNVEAALAGVRGNRYDLCVNP